MRGWLAMGAALSVGACQPREPMGPVGTSTPGPTPRHGGPGTASEVASPVPQNFRTDLAKVNRDRFIAKGHAGGRFEANVYVTPAAKDAAFAFIGKVQMGTTIVMEEIEHGKGNGSGPLLMMEKMAPGFAEAHGDWRYAVVDGKAVTMGALDSCVSCHDEAPNDHVFRIPDPSGDE
jgi:hypothetical protein